LEANIVFDDGADVWSPLSLVSYAKKAVKLDTPLRTSLISPEELHKQLSGEGDPLVLGPSCLSGFRNGKLKAITFDSANVARRAVGRITQP